MSLKIPCPLEKDKLLKRTIPGCQTERNPYGTWTMSLCFRHLNADAGQIWSECPHQDSNLGPADYEGKFRGRRFKLFRKRRPFLCPPLPWASTVSTPLRRVCVEFRRDSRPRAPALNSRPCAPNSVTMSRTGRHGHEPSAPSPHQAPSGSRHRSLATGDPASSSADSRPEVSILANDPLGTVCRPATRLWGNGRCFRFGRPVPSDRTEEAVLGFAGGIRWRTRTR